MKEKGKHIADGESYLVSVFKIILIFQKLFPLKLFLKNNNQIESGYPFKRT